MAGNLILVVLALSLAAYFVGQAQGRKFVHATPVGAVHSRPIYHGAFVAVWVGVPALLLVLAWLMFQGTVLDRLLLASLPDTMTDGATTAQLSLYLTEVKNVAAGLQFGEPSPAIVAAAERYVAWSQIARWAMVVAALSVAILAMMVARARLAPLFRARQGSSARWSILMVHLAGSPSFTTIGINRRRSSSSRGCSQEWCRHRFPVGLNWEAQIAIRPDKIAARALFGAIPGLRRHAAMQHTSSDGRAGRNRARSRATTT